ncbi:MAG TPA: hypothetical protein VGJ32_05980 [Solirubrobacteraceae bacterium]
MSIPANTYWAVADSVLAGPHPDLVEAFPPGLRGGLQRLLDAGVRRFVDLTAYGDSYEGVLRELDPRAGYVRRPIDDLDVPSDDEMREILADLTSGDVVYVHCRYGLGRTGTVVGCLLVEQGIPGSDALRRLRELRSGCADADLTSPETAEQRAFVERWTRRATV